MKNKIRSQILLLAILVGAFPIGLNASGGLSINEIMYDAVGTDSHHEWIEIYNNSLSPIKIRDIRLFENGVNHSISSATITEIPPSAYAIIAGKEDVFRADFPDFDGIVLTASFSLSNEGEEIALKNKDGTVIDSISYTSAIGGAGDGNTISRRDGIFDISTSTPGKESNFEIVEDISDDEVVSDNNKNSENKADDTITPVKSTTTSATINEKKVKRKNYAGSIQSVKNGVVGVEQIFKPEIIDLYSEVITGGEFYWNFGDGNSLWMKDSSPVRHSYEFPGNYAVLLEYTKNNGDEPLMTIRSQKKIINPNLGISPVEKKGRNYLKIDNNDTAEIKIDDFVISADDKRILFPKNSVILGKSSIHMDITNLFEENGRKISNEHIKLHLPNGDIVAEWKSLQTENELKIVRGIEVALPAEDKIDEIPEREIKKDKSISAIGKYGYIAGLIGLILVTYYGLNLIQKEAERSLKTRDFDFE